MNLIKTKRLLIREIEEKDFLYLLSLYTQKENMQYVSGGRCIWKPDEIKAKYEEANKELNNGIGLFIVETKERGVVIGEAGLSSVTGEPSAVELSFIVDFDFWRQGFGLEVCKGLIRYAFSKLHAQRVVARPDVRHIAAVRLCEKAGMKRTESSEANAGELSYLYEIKNDAIAE